MNPFNGTQLCDTDENKDLFFSPYKNDKIKAQSICSQCPMFEVCKTEVKDKVGLYGTWAGKWFDGSGYVSPVIVIRKSREEEEICLAG